MSKRVAPSLDEEVSPEAFGEAMALCQGYAPECSASFCCQLDGQCFTNDGKGFRAARREIEALVAEADRDVYKRAWLKVALDALDDRRFSEGVKDALRYAQAQKAARKAYGLKL